MLATNVIGDRLREARSPVARAVGKTALSCVSYYVVPSSCSRAGACVPRKIRQLKSDLKKARFVERPDRGKGSHAFWIHPKHTGVSVTVAGHDGDDAQGYQETQVREAIARAQLAD